MDHGVVRHEWVTYDFIDCLDKTTDPDATDPVIKLHKDFMMKYLLIDTREKPKKITGIVDYFDSIGLIHESTKLLFGDYMDFNRPEIVVDRKHNIAELAKNCTIESARFVRELERAKKAGARLVILVEQNRYKTEAGEWVTVGQLSDLIYWSSKNTTIRGEKVFRVLMSWINRYNLSVEFCNKAQTGQRIYEIIYGEHR
jgi:ERCC4-type nuclease